MLENLARVEERFEELAREMARPEVATNYIKQAEYGQERAKLEPLVTIYREYADTLEQIAQSQELLDEEDAELVALARSEIEALEPHAEKLIEKIRRMLLPKDPRDDRNVIVEIRAGAGGDEAGLFGADLARMYMRYAETHRWKTAILSANETGVGGYKEIVFEVSGKGAYSRFKYESGVHRVQRVPITETSGRIHTSTATVAVLPEMNDVDVHIDASDLSIENYTASGPGGQHMQKNATAVRITHTPSGIVVSCENQRSQTQNRLQALAVLRARLYDMEQQKQTSEIEAARRLQVGSGERSEKIRTYNFAQNRVTDHRIGLSLYNLDGVLNGSLNPLVDALTDAEQARGLAALGE